ncbi:hypothetical protein FACS1894116_12750 [Betaproteobacteria bacterium]|nr:hypothetical protein FACS1894116_12750 [Betaproteobacteria bacterium]GHT99608.1 hypothetical protein FACS1894154_07020 [Betaproteobacteria bacterium]GHU23662.1 hypothetical protein FACS189488_06700 [Betaproteobacteria bacterium]GHU30217.1 hypothetical protein FACS189497_09620 [Betaproteobacteria bacterium]
MDYSSLRSQFNDLYKKHARTKVVDTGWLGKGLSSEEITKIERVLKCTLPEDVKLISAEISSFAFETPYFLGDRSPEKLCASLISEDPSLSEELQDDLEIQTVSSIQDWGWGDDFAELWAIEVDLVNLYVEKGMVDDIIIAGEIDFKDIINREVVPFGFSNKGTLYINLYDQGKNIGSVMNMVQFHPNILIQTLSNSYEEFIGNMLTSLKRGV